MVVEAGSNLAEKLQQDAQHATVLLQEHLQLQYPAL